MQIKSRSENEFIFKRILKSSSFSIWLGATNILDTNKFEWLDGNKFTDFGSKDALMAEPVDQRNGLAMSGHGSNAGRWIDYTETSMLNVLCESTRSETLSKDMDLFEETYLKKIDEQKELIYKLQGETNNIATELEIQKRHCDQSIAGLKGGAGESNKMIKRLKGDVSWNKKQKELLMKQNELLEMRLSRLEQKMSSNVIDNSNKQND